MPMINRRKLLKAISAASAAAAIPVSVNAAANFKTEKHIAVYIDTQHSQFKGSASRHIINRSNKPMVLNGYQPVTTKNSDGGFTTMHLNTPKSMYTLMPGERLPVYAQAVMTSSPSPAQQLNSLASDSIVVV